MKSRVHVLKLVTPSLSSSSKEIRPSPQTHIVKTDSAVHDRHVFCLLQGAASRYSVTARTSVFSNDAAASLGVMAASPGPELLEPAVDRKELKRSRRFR